MTERPRTGFKNQERIHPEKFKYYKIFKKEKNDIFFVLD